MNKKVTVTLRLTVDEARILDRLARAHETTRSEALRTALIGEVERLAQNGGLTAHDRMKKYIPLKGSAWKGRRPSALEKKDTWFEHLERKHRAIRID